MKAYLYKIVNNINNKEYIGQTLQSLAKRWSEHCNNSSCCKVLKYAIQKYGKENFTILVLEEIEYYDKFLVKEELNRKEMEYIANENTLVPNGYNVLRGGNSAPGRRWKTPPMQGKKWTDEHRKNFIAAKTGMKYGPQSPEQIRNRSEKCKKSIICNETGQIWPSIKECAESFGAKSEQVHRMLRGNRKHFRKLTFSYHNSVPIKFSDEAREKLSKMAKEQIKS